MKENFFKKEEIIKFFSSLPEANNTQDQVYNCKEKIAIMTHDDTFDQEMFDYEKSLGLGSTFFLLTNKIKEFDKSADLGLHYDKEMDKTLSEQIEEFKKKTQITPKINRNHRLWWRGDHLDLLHLSMNGIKADSTKVGIKPYKLCVQGKILPIWEIPFSISDQGYVSLESNSHIVYNKASKMEHLFEEEITPLTALFHPYLKKETEWKRFYELADKHSYKILTISEFYGKYLQRIKDQEV